MKLLSKISLLALATFMMVGLSACSDDTDPADVDVFVGNYKGKISYVKLGEETKSNENGTVNVSKVGDTYNFIFSDGIPSITGVKFEKKDDNTFISIGSGLTGITITENKLVMGVAKDGATWTANCTR
ncbi:MAG: hypothetical protein ACOYEA_08770 [Fermentimonas sp.]|jgi:hypothetical protein